MRIHPLRLFFESRGFSAGAGMDWLQGDGRERYGALVSDLCIEPEDVAPCDCDAVLRLAGARHFIPVSRRTEEDEAIMRGN